MYDENGIFEIGPDSSLETFGVFLSTFKATVQRSTELSVGEERVHNRFRGYYLTAASREKAFIGHVKPTFLEALENIVEGMEDVGFPVTWKARPLPPAEPQQPKPWPGGIPPTPSEIACNLELRLLDVGDTCPRCGIEAEWHPKFWKRKEQGKDV